MVYLTSKQKLKNFTIVEIDPENEGMIREQTPHENIKDLDAKAVGYIEPDNVNGVTTGYSNNFLYNVNIDEDDLKRILMYRDELRDKSF